MTRAMARAMTDRTPPAKPRHEARNHTRMKLRALNSPTTTSRERSLPAARSRSRLAVSTFAWVAAFLSSAATAALSADGSAERASFGDPKVVTVDGAHGATATVRRGASSGGGAGAGNGNGNGNGAGIGRVNGDFDAGLEAWTSGQSGGDDSPGEVTSDGGQALLTEGDSFLVTLRQRFRVPSFTTALSFDVLLDPGFDVSDAKVPDAFEVSLLDDEFLPIATPWDALATSAFNLQEDGTALMGAGVLWDGTTATIDMSGVARGSTVNLFFDLIGADRDVLSAVRIDNVRLEIDLPAGAFVRGDFDNDRTVDAGDEQAVLDYLWNEGPESLGCIGTPNLDTADVNDNEWVTIADYLRVRSARGGGGAIPTPTEYCDVDPTDEQRGFDTIDTAYRVTAGSLEVTPEGGAENRRVMVPILIDTPSAVTGLTLVLEYPTDILTPFDPLAGDAPPFTSALGESAFHVANGRLVIGLWSSADGETLVEADAGDFQRVGEVGFHLEDFAILRPFFWSQETELGEIVFRATVVDEQFEDHHPELPVGQFECVRGNSNNDSRVDISDAVHTLCWLFNGGPEPRCMDAADSNNSSVVDISDPVFTLNFLFLGGAPIPAPYPQCGLDEGPIDTLDCDPCACPPYPVDHPCNDE